ncbi:MAG: glutamate-1-semialdehyde 2,1-aminomutase [Oligoflexales bacterium]|nr:glutamate-1-semialdehyde 2,1-aminomutase [Oligoflexales bacterium]
MPKSIARSQELFIKSQALIPGGVNSPVRSFCYVDGNPVFIEAGKGSKLWDADGNEYIDYVGSWGVAILGHAHAEVVSAVQKAAEKGLSYGALTEGEYKLVQKINSVFPSMEKMRLVSSGTEACMTAIRLARGFTRRDKIVKFTGNYHGHADMLLAKAGSGLATLSLPGSAGVPKSVVENTLLAPYNDIAAVERLFEEHRHEIAAVIIEPLAGNAGFIQPKAGFLESLRKLTRREESLLIFDEVITGFRLCWGGMQTLHDIQPDLTTLGKIVGGGLPLAVFGGRKDIMDCLAPLGPVYQAGTLSGNPIAVAAGLCTLEVLDREKARVYPQLTQRTKSLVTGLQDIASQFKIPFTADCEGGMFGFFFHPEHISSFEEAQKSNTNLFKSFFKGMLSAGVYLAPSPFEAGFVSSAHEQTDIEMTLKAARSVLSSLS